MHYVFYVCLRKYQNQIKICGISFDCKSYGVFEEIDRGISKHNFFQTKVKFDFKSFRNIKVSVPKLIAISYYDEKKKWFRYNGKPLRKLQVESPSDFKMFDYIAQDINSSLNHSTFLSCIDSLKKNIVDFESQFGTTYQNFDVIPASKVIEEMRYMGLKEFDPISEDFFFFSIKFKESFEKAGGHTDQSISILKAFLDNVGLNLVFRLQKKFQDASQELTLKKLCEELDIVYTRLKIYKLQEFYSDTYSTGRVHDFVTKKIKLLESFYPEFNKKQIVEHTIMLLKLPALINQFCPLINEVNDSYSPFLSAVKMYDIYSNL